MHANCEVYLGVATSDGGAAFVSEPGTAIHLDGILYNIEHHDCNSDGQLDMAFTTFSSGIVNTVPLLVGSILTNTIPEDLEFFRMDGGGYPAKPLCSKFIISAPCQAEGGTLLAGGSQQRWQAGRPCALPISYRIASSDVASGQVALTRIDILMRRTLAVILGALVGSITLLVVSVPLKADSA